MRIREATADDFDGLMRLYRQLHPEDPVLADGRDRATFERIRRTDGLHLFVLEADGQIVSTCYLNVIPNLTRAARPYAILENVVTDEAVRRRGFGRLIVEHALEAAWACGCYKVLLQTGSRQEATHAFYRACGFSADDKTGYVARPPTAREPWPTAPHVNGT